MQRLALALSLVLSVTGSFGCSDDASDGSGGGATSGSGGGPSGGSSSGSSAVGGSSSGSSTVGGSGSSTAGATTGGSSAGGSGGSAGSGFTKRGICGQKSEGTVTPSSYEAVEEFYMVSDENRQEGILDEFICHIRLSAKRVGEAPPECQDLDGVACEWTHKVELSEPMVVTNVDNACEKNEFVWDAAWMAELDGSEVSYGYIDEYTGHDSVVMKAVGAAGSEMWEVFGRASWTESSGELTFDNRIGECRY